MRVTSPDLRPGPRSIPLGAAALAQLKLR